MAAETLKVNVATDGKTCAGTGTTVEPSAEAGETAPWWKGTYRSLPFEELERSTT